MRPLLLFYLRNIKFIVIIKAVMLDAEISADSSPTFSVLTAFMNSYEPSV